MAGRSWGFFHRYGAGGCHAAFSYRVLPATACHGCSRGGVSRSTSRCGDLNGLSLPIVIWNNDGLGAIVGHMNAREIPQMAVDTRSGNPDFVRLAGAYGFGVRLETLAEATRVVRAGFERRRPPVIDLREEMVQARTI